MKRLSKFYSVPGGIGEPELTLHQIPLMRNAFSLLTFPREWDCDCYIISVKKKKWYLQAPNKGLIWAAYAETV